MKNPNVTILGATGAVGREMLKILEERNFPIGELRCLASARSVGKKLPFAGREIMVEEATDAAFTDADIVLGAAENDIARRFAPAIKATGAVFIDNSSAFRMDEDVPLVVPEINPGRCSASSWHHCQSKLLHHHHSGSGCGTAPSFANHQHGSCYISGGFRCRCRWPGGAGSRGGRPV